MIYTIRTTVGRENAVIETLSNKVKNLKLNIKSLLHPAELKGYIFIEGELGDIEKIISGIPHIRGMIPKEVAIKEIKHFLETKKVEIKVTRGDIIEIIAGPFKGEKGKITRVDESKEEVTIELLETAVPIPITVVMDSIKILERAEEKK